MRGGSASSASCTPQRKPLLIRKHSPPRLSTPSGASATLLDRDLRPVGQLTPESGMAPATCMHLDSSSACLTLGHADGSLNVWDLPSRRTVAASQALGRGGICSVSSPAGDPSSVYAAAKDGSVWCLVSVGEGYVAGKVSRDTLPWRSKCLMLLLIGNLQWLQIGHAAAVFAAPHCTLPARHVRCRIDGLQVQSLLP